MHRNIIFGGYRTSKFAMLSYKKLKHLLFFGFWVLLLQIQCKKQGFSDDTYFGGKVIILGHKGMGQLYSRPGNTYEAIFPVFGIGADGTEMDLQLSKDTVLVLFHNNFMNEGTSCSGRINEKDWSEIRKCKYTALPLYQIYINSVDELFSKIPDLNKLYFSFDCKLDQDVLDKELYLNQYLRAIQRLCLKYNMSNNIFLEGDSYFLRKAQNLGLTNKLFLFSELNETAIHDAFNNRFFGISTSIDKLYDRVSVAHKKGLYVMAWSPDNYSENKLALDSKADIIQTDDPISLLKILNRYNYEYTLP